VGDTDGLALGNYVSENTTQFSKIPDDPQALEDLGVLRGSSEVDMAVHKALSWETRKDHDIHVGISLAIPDPVGEAAHEI
jgi:hypothetical protein